MRSTSSRNAVAVSVALLCAFSLGCGSSQDSDSNGTPSNPSQTSPGLVFVTGGMLGGGAPSSVTAQVAIGRVRYDGSIDSWASGPAMLRPRKWHGAGVVDGHVVVWGGWTGAYRGGLNLSAIEAAAIQSNGGLASWLDIGSLPRGFADLAGASDGNSIYAAGGYDYGLLRDTVECRLAANATSVEHCHALQPLANPRDYAAAAVAAGQLFVVGGIGRGGRAQDVMTSVEAVPVSGSRTFDTDALSSPRKGHGVLSYQNRLYVIGGWSGSYGGGINYSSVMIGSVDAGGSIQWTAGPSLTRGHADNCVARVGRFIYSIGGYDYGLLDDVEFSAIQADGSLSEWRQTTALPYGVDYCAATGTDAIPN
jgi:hypothetical protein